jgi:hypothetical protein
MLCYLFIIILFLSMLLCLCSRCLFSFFDLFWKNTSFISAVFRFGLNADPDPDPGFYFNAAPFLVRICRHEKMNFYMKNLFYM